MKRRPVAIGLVLGIATSRLILLLAPVTRQAVLCGLLLGVFVILAGLLFETLKANRMLAQNRRSQERIREILEASDRSRALLDNTVRELR
jgi:hypothetical protein